jgi:hypothetical protein
MQIGISFKTTNLIESVMARIEAKTHRITRWRTSDQKQRWCAATLLEIEQQFWKVKGHRISPCSEPHCVANSSPQTLPHKPRS